MFLVCCVCLFFGLFFWLGGLVLRNVVVVVVFVFFVVVFLVFLVFCVFFVFLVVFVFCFFGFSCGTTPDSKEMGRFWDGRGTVYLCIYKCIHTLMCFYASVYVYTDVHSFTY